MTRQACRRAGGMLPLRGKLTISVVDIGDRVSRRLEHRPTHHAVCSQIFNLLQVRGFAGAIDQRESDIESRFARLLRFLND